MRIERPAPKTDVAQLLAAGTGERLALAAPHTSPAKLAETLTAMANGHGGVILVGMTTGGRAVGIEDVTAEREVIQAAGLLSTPPLILPMPQIVTYEDRPLAIVEVPPGLPHVYSLGGRYLTRSGNHNRLLTTGELSSLLLERGEAGFESRVVSGAGPDDLDPEQIEDYLRTVEGWPGADWEKGLLARGCLAQSADGALPTYAGILLFGSQPQRFLRNADIILVRYAGPQMGDEFMRHHAAGTLPEQIRQAEAFVTANMRHGMRLRGFVRQEVTEYPLSVVREVIVNAVAHRDYAIRGEGIRVLMFSDHMEMYSPGRLPGPRHPRQSAQRTLLAERGHRAGAFRPGLRGAIGLRH